MQFSLRRIHQGVSSMVIALLVVAALAACGGSGGNEQQTVMTWCRLAAFPANRTDEKIDAKEYNGIREIDVTFTAKPADLTAWVAASAGLKEAIAAPAQSAAGAVTMYTIASKEKNGSYCVALISPTTGLVRIKAYQPPK